MSWPEKLFRLDGAFPSEFTPRRYQTLGKLLVLGLIAAFPASYFAYHLERVEPFVDNVSTFILETLVDDENDTAPSAEP